MLDSYTVKILKYIKKHPDIDIKQITDKFGETGSDTAKYLSKEGYVLDRVSGYAPAGTGHSPVPIHSNKYRISPKGRICLAEEFDNRVRYWVSIIISYLVSVASLAISIIALSKQ